MLCQGLADPTKAIVVARVIEMKTLHVPTEFRRTVKAPAQGCGNFDGFLRLVLGVLDGLNVASKELVRNFAPSQLKQILAGAVQQDCWR
jgi:hypothetical protein